MKLSESKLRSIIREELQEIYDAEKHKDDVFRSNSPQTPEEVVQAAAEYQHSMQVDATPSGRYVGLHDAKDVPEAAYETLDEYMQRVEGRNANKRERKQFAELVAKKNRQADADREMYM